MASSPGQVFRKFVGTLGEKYVPGEIYAASGMGQSLKSPIRHLARLIEYLESQAVPHGRPFKYCAGLIGSWKPTGYSSHLDEQFCMGVTSAMYCCCLEMSIRYFQSEQAFRKIGQWRKAEADRHSDEVPKFWGFNWRGELAAWIELHKDSPDQKEQSFDAWSVPRYAQAFTIDCPIRMACAQYVSQMMVKFLWTHEFGHIIGGHLLYLKHREQEEIRTLSENDFWFEKSQEEKWLYAAVRLWMEHDADTSAVNTLLLNNLQGVTIQKTGMDEIDGDKDLRARLDVISVILTLLIILFQYDWADSNAGTHPDPLRRIFAAVGSAIQLLMTHHPTPERIVSDINADILGLANASAFHRFLIPMFFTPLTMEMSLNEYNDLVTQVSSVVPQIREFSFFDANGRLEVPA